MYERDGAYQFYVTAMQPDGIGSLYLAFEQLKKKLEGEGLFAPERKKPIPRFPRAIGVITSPTGAAIRDVIITLQRRFPSIPILLYPVLVQGTQAAPSIVKAIEAMNRLGEADVLIVGRGGGSLEELWAFNEEMRCAGYHAASAIPIISAVGHETDFTIADFVADLQSADAYGGGRARGAAPPRAEAAAIAAGAAPALRAAAAAAPQAGTAGAREALAVPDEPPQAAADAACGATRPAGGAARLPDASAPHGAGAAAFEAGASLIQLQSNRAGRDGEAAFGCFQTSDAHGHADPPALEEAGVAIQRPPSGRPQPAEGYAAGV